MVSLVYDEEHEALIEEARRQALKILPWERLKDARAAAAAWSTFSAQGWGEAFLPAELGGGELPLAVSLGLARVCGERLAVEEVVNGVVLIPTLVSRIADVALRDELLSRDGGCFLVADGRSRSGLSPESAQQVRWVCGVTEEAMPIRLRTDGDALVVECWPVGCYDFAPLADIALGIGTVRLSGEPTTSAPLDLSPAALEDTMLTAQLAHAAALVGVAAAALQITVDYTRVREQFGRQIGQFQAVKHILADVSASTEAAWSTCLFAACSGSRNDVSAAHILAARAVDLAGAAVVQVHGGIGYTWEHPAHLFLKTAMVGVQRFDPTRQLLDAVDLHVSTGFALGADSHIPDEGALMAWT
jgi:alkylation response protein AidB-like acyl-CoA dehydrogenase